VRLRNETCCTASTLVITGVIIALLRLAGAEFPDERMHNHHRERENQTTCVTTTVIETTELRQAHRVR